MLLYSNHISFYGRVIFNEIEFDILKAGKFFQLLFSDCYLFIDVSEQAKKQEPIILINNAKYNVKCM